MRDPWEVYGRPTGAHRSPIRDPWTPTGSNYMPMGAPGRPMGDHRCLWKTVDAHGRSWVPKGDPWTPAGDQCTLVRLMGAHGVHRDSWEIRDARKRHMGDPRETHGRSVDAHGRPWTPTDAHGCTWKTHGRPLEINVRP